MRIPFISNYFFLSLLILSGCNSQSLKSGAPVEIQTVYPLGQQIPQNILRFYVYFNQPMHRKSVEKSIWFENENGTIIDDVVLGMSSGLWSPDHRRLTLLMDPGRVKSGLSANQKLGLAFKVGETIRLVVGKNAKSAYGKPFKRPFRKTYQVTAPDSSPPDLSKWVIKTPSPDTQSPVVIRFAETIDHALVQSQLQIVDQSKKVIRGIFKSKNFEQGLSFIPINPWTAGEYFIVATIALEDMAANSLRGVFDKNPKDQWLPLDQTGVSRAFQVNNATKRGR